ncbi:MAG: hypothetical protein JO022_14940 [Acidobacteriaceae bacterium]|nr:hypothetical protein [Acidobacteriaceae bacterium]
MTPKVTRRQLATAALAAPALIAQTPAAAPATDEPKTVRDQMRQNGELLARFDVPANIEPAVHFKA